MRQCIIKNQKKTTWECCSCGCKGSKLSVGPASCWMYTGIVNPGLFHLRTGHHKKGMELGSFQSFKAIDEAARKFVKKSQETRNN